MQRCRELTYWQYFCDYFPAVLVKEADLDPSKNYIFGYHPHGMWPTVLALIQKSLKKKSSSDYPKVGSLKVEHNCSLVPRYARLPSSRYVNCGNKYILIWCAVTIVPGIISMGAFCMFNTEATGFGEKFPGIKARCAEHDTQTPLPPPAPLLR